MPRLRTIFLVSLGCPKNRVDSEVMLGLARDHGLAVADDPASADVIVVNTCGFIDPAKSESIDTILEMAEHKRSGNCKKLIVTGCLAQRHHAELAQGMPEVDVLLGSGDLARIVDAIRGDATGDAVGSAAGYLVSASERRIVSTGASAYVKIAEGCDRRCAFCVIPQLRGNHRSREVADIVREVEWLASQGVMEVNLVSQDTSAYGRDLPAKESLARLVQKLNDVRGVHWIRLLYLYPDTLDDALVDLLASGGKVLPYVDMPMQHAADRMLRAMRRGHTKARLRAIVERLRKRVPGLTMRSAFIVGFPGETDEDFEELIEFIRWANLDRVGVFRYSDEEGTPAHGMGEKVRSSRSYARARRLMAEQRKNSRRNNREMVGRELEVLVEGPSPEHELVMMGRHGGQAPEIDGQVYFTDSEVEAGQVWRAEVVRATDYDLVVEARGDKPIAAAKRLRSLSVVS